jgi:RNA polymerase sigma-70 factor (ECF subfamily)
MATSDSFFSADLALVAACARGEAAAVRDLDERLRVEVRRAVTPLDESGELVDEVTQIVRERLLMPAADGRVRLLDYSGEGPLGAWLRAMAVRLALNLRRQGAREELVSQAPDAPLADPDPELALLRARHREAFRGAFVGALEALTPRDRTLLRLTALDGLTCAQVGQMYAKDASTISRWIAQARAVLLERTRLTLRQSLALSDAALDSVMRAADSELAFSLSRLLESRPE